MARFRKKPIVVEAVQVERWGPTLPDGVCCCGVAGAFDLGQIRPHVHTLEGVMRVSLGDWIIRGVKGELYPCKPDIFAATYEAVDEEEVKPCA